ncbi:MULTISPECIES: response regulator [unclassified Massilia]|uniref:response regulator n=1 Tax=unclassified Massilia TaxID=2609279 RepID=UPI00177F9E24|nr:MULTISPECIES: response regulator [unclassified Massilia]MBD8531689.1 response regulator [Massilia sp. CFBP 13647]MBD8675134.1 response regulator [Massilia sp. CFBP 13721]
MPRIYIHLTTQERADPQIVLLDIGMPGMYGYEVAAALRGHPKSKEEVYIAALTGWNNPATRAPVISAGFDKHLTKPAKVEIVLDLLEHVVA